MPISEDEIEHGYGTHHSQLHSGGMSKAEQRRSNKPIMEKRRRARINHCLNELKSLILDAMKKDPARHSKLEKADILEMTVKHLQTIQRQQLSMAISTDPSVVHKFKTGFNECAGEVSRYIGRMEGVEVGVKQRLVTHLASCVNGLQQISPFTLPGNSSGSQSTTSAEDVNNNTASARLQMMTGLQLIPSRLPTGELALLLPNSQHLPFFPAPLDNQVSTTSDSPNATVTSNSVDRSHNSAFTAVGRDKFLTRSPLPSPTSTTASSYGEESSDQPYPSPGHPPEVSSTSEHTRIPEEPTNFINYSQKPKIGVESQSLLQVPIGHFMEFTKDPKNQNLPRFTPSAVKTIQPLTVITSDEMLKEHPQRYLDVHSQDMNFKDPLDYSVKKDAFSLPFPPSFKRPYEEDHSDKLLMKSTEYHPPFKAPKIFLENNYEKRHEIQDVVPKLPTNCRVPINYQSERRSVIAVHSEPSTSASEDSRDMWRPW